MHITFAQNLAGRDLIVGDIHGCFSQLQTCLYAVGFDPLVDRLFSVGDLADRGPESELALEWLNKPWFHPVRGNHEQMAIDYVAGHGDFRAYIFNGGSWFADMTREEQCLYADAFSALPLAITLETADGPVGIVHAECPVDTWEDMLEAFTGKNAEQVARCCMWGRDRISNMR
jgi:serine/threonine protein phosphatase 1